MDKEMQDAINELRKEYISDSLVGNKTWTDDTKILLTFEKIKKLKSKLLEFDSMIQDLDKKHEEKKVRLRENWRIDSSLKEIDKLELAVKMFFDVPVVNEKVKEEEKSFSLPASVLEGMGINDLVKELHEDVVEVKDDSPKIIGRIKNPFLNEEEEL